jgi:predicted metal-dependent phosphoesterase TrpH
MRKYIDNHIHSKFSDGELSPKQIVTEVEKNNGKAFSITDHDNVASISALKKFQSESGVIYIPGVELTAYLKNEEISDDRIRLHILGYGISENCAWFNSDLKRKSIVLETRNREFIMKFLNEFSFIDPSSFKHFDCSKFGWIKKRLQANLDFATFSERECQQILSFLKEEEVLYDNYSYDSLEAIKIIHSIGGLAAFAHPYQTNLSDEKLEKLTRVLRDVGLDGIETIYSGSPKRDMEYAKYLAQKYKLLQSSGSDFHTFIGDNGNRVCYGINGNMRVESCTLNDELIKKKTFLKLSLNSRGE